LPRKHTTHKQLRMLKFMFEKETRKLVDTIKTMKRNGAFKTYIDYIRFPYYRNLEKNTKINFDFPLTVFIGKNGSGKSSTLQAVFGAPADKSVGNFWFSTELDPIQESESDERHCFIYGYKIQNEILEVLKTRIKKAKKPDYWEPSRPIKKYGMKLMGGERNSAINMDVLYLDFRSILSAFDKYFYFGDTKRLKSKTKQDYLRSKSKHLKNVINNHKIYKNRGVDQNRDSVIISGEELNVVGRILDKNYVSAQIIEHKLFDSWGFSVIFETEKLTYSEAFAGSGETAIFKLVHEVQHSEPGTLVLLDEPEVSLHPGAQYRLKLYLLEKIKEKRLQVIISTHSPFFSEFLPQSAIKVFLESPNEKIRVSDHLTYKEAFLSIGHDIEKVTIIVEDRLAKRLMGKILKNMDANLSKLFNIEYYPGGASVINKDIIIYSRSERPNIYILFDGDQKPSKQVPDISSIPQKKLTNVFLTQAIKEVTGSKITFYPDGGKQGGDKNQETEMKKEYLNYYRENVFYLPASIPEEIIWDSEYSKSLLKITLGEGNVTNEAAKKIGQAVGYKAKFGTLAEYMDSSIDSLHDLFIKAFINGRGEFWNDIINIINVIKEKESS